MYRVCFKHEDEIRGVAVGEVTVYTAAELDEKGASGRVGVPYDPDRIRRWVTRPEAVALAAEYDATLEDV